MEPSNSDWDFKYQAKRIINHPNSKPVVQKTPRTTVAMKSSQLPLAPAGVGTYYNFQGKTAKDELGIIEVKDRISYAAVAANKAKMIAQKGKGQRIKGKLAKFHIV